MAEHMCALCGFDWSRVRAYLGIVRIVLCDGCNADVIRAAMALAPIGVPAQWTETTPATATVN